MTPGANRPRRLRGDSGHLAQMIDFVVKIHGIDLRIVPEPVFGVLAQVVHDLRRAHQRGGITRGSRVPHNMEAGPGELVRHVGLHVGGDIGEFVRRHAFEDEVAHHGEQIFGSGQLRIALMKRAEPFGYVHDGLREAPRSLIEPRQIDEPGRHGQFLRRSEGLGYGSGIAHAVALGDLLHDILVRIAEPFGGQRADVVQRVLEAQEFGSDDVSGELAQLCRVDGVPFLIGRVEQGCKGLADALIERPRIDGVGPQARERAIFVDRIENGPEGVRVGLDDVSLLGDELVQDGVEGFPVGAGQGAVLRSAEPGDVKAVRAGELPQHNGDLFRISKYLEL